jgi:hypothetical protein
MPIEICGQLGRITWRILLLFGFSWFLNYFYDLILFPSEADKVFPRRSGVRNQGVQIKTKLHLNRSAKLHMRLFQMNFEWSTFSTSSRVDRFARSNGTANEGFEPRPRFCWHSGEKTPIEIPERILQAGQRRESILRRIACRSTIEWTRDITQNSAEYPLLKFHFFQC